MFEHMERKEFVQKTCKGLIFTFAASFLSACEGAEDASGVIRDPDEEFYENTIAKIGDEGYLKEKNIVYYKLSNSMFLELSKAGGFINEEEHGVLLLRVNEKNIRAFDNCCPHLGSRNLWSLVGNQFRCANHGNSYGTAEGQTAYCSSNTRYGNLRSFPTKLYKDLLIVTF
jgi:nitrite reductase/ring-hydroxylating ferredoxin subunit